MQTISSFLSLKRHRHYYHGIVRDYKTLNQSIITNFQTLAKQPDKESHFFHGRYENIYIEESRFPSLTPLLTALKQTSGSILAKDAAELKLGYWFNNMQPSDQTTAHTHDDDDELLSCVYYIKVPENSGNLVLEPVNTTKITIIPQEGHAIFFKPNLLHYVTQNLSQQSRLSIAINFGYNDCQRED